MAEWYVEDNGRATGPFSVQQMKAQAAASRIKPETKVRKGRKGKWIEAKRVQGLLGKADAAKSAKTKSKLSSPSELTKQQKKGSVTPQVQPRSNVEEGTFLVPARNRKRRAFIFACLVAFVCIGTAPIIQVLFFALTVGLMIGSYPLVEVKKKKIEQTLIVFFFPVHKKTYKLRDFVAVMPGTEPRIADTIGCLVLFFFWYWFLFRLFDHLMPWLGGNYKLNLKQYDDEQILIWQGNNAADFEANLALLQSAGLPIE